MTYNPNKARDAYNDDCLHCRMMKLINDYSKEHELVQEGEDDEQFIRMVAHRLGTCLADVMDNASEDMQGVVFSQFIHAFAKGCKDNNMNALIHIDEQTQPETIQ